MESLQEDAERQAGRFCTQCGRPFAADDMLRYGESWICADCKPSFAQRLREGAALPNARLYGGFWIRFAAILLDGLILGVLGIAVSVVLSLAFGASMLPAEITPEAMTRIFLVTGIATVINMGLALGYQVYFLPRSGATPGKAALGLKVIRSDGGPISPGRAAGRYFGTMLSSFTFFIGYLMAAFDSEKRALHDYVCDTRVIRVS